MRTLLCALVALGWAGVVEADDGNRLLEICKSPAGSEERAHCLGYVKGVSETLFFLAARGVLDGSPCLPHGTTLGQSVDVVVTYLTEHPKDRNKSAAVLVTTALNKEWPPCHHR